MAPTVAASHSSPKGNGYSPRLGRVLLPVLMLSAAGLFMMGILMNVARITRGNLGPIGTDFCVLFAGGALYAAGFLYIWHYVALALTRQWLTRLVTRLEAEAAKTEPNSPLSW
ncbi:hypothetical protein EDD75_0703 [Thermodesulfitimonas autotrophica]|uniref:Uncharacterized protein n=1 Tax=Thermodesulfitimonas autotrophica TaxID=1894989 RepID=A0A3N5AY35_9THEO|nr:hypothetical protein [Thermodesulfitimonas autotrophica]RPF49877.1 hypothetical protein EDD75_0703 [Thermodesulfitimonas autotrophica]